MSTSGQPIESIDPAEVDLEAMSHRLEAQARSLKISADAAAEKVERLDAGPVPGVGLDPDFAEKLEQSLAGPRRRLRRIAKLAE